MRTGLQPTTTGQMVESYTDRRLESEQTIHKAVESRLPMEQDGGGGVGDRVFKKDGFGAGEWSPEAECVTMHSGNPSPLSSTRRF